MKQLRQTIATATVAATVAVCVSQVSVASPAFAAEAAAGGGGSQGAEAAGPSEFRPGNVGFGVQVPADTTLPGSTELHPCAGRKLAYHSHIDAIYATHHDGELTNMIVDGQVPTPSDELCVRLAPDANSAGTEVSRLVVPDDPKLAFLGEPGTILWYAPQEIPFADKWRPVWAGAGAFDPHHEWSVPTDFEGKKVTVELSDFKGPGQMEMFFYNRSEQQPDRRFSTKDNIRSTTLDVGSHGHYSWTFTKPGIYHLTWTITGKKKDGSTETSKPVTTTWLVGSDDDVQLPPGTTTELGEITTSAEDLRDAMFGEAPSTEAPVPSETETVTESTEQVKKILWRSFPRTVVRGGHQDMGPVGKAGESKAYMHNDVDGQDHRSGSFFYAVPNTALRQIPSKISAELGGVCAGWVLPQSQDPALPWQGFSTERFDYSTLSTDGLTVSISAFDGPGRMITAHDSLTETTVALDSADPGSSIKYPDRAHDHMTFVFTQPGAYSVRYTFEGKTPEGKPVSNDLLAHYVVGDSALFDAATLLELDPAALGFAEPETRDSTPECTPEPPADTVEPTTPPTQDSREIDPQAVGLALGGGVIAIRLAQHLMGLHGNAPAPARSTAKNQPAQDKHQTPVAQPEEPQPSVPQPRPVPAPQAGAAGGSAQKPNAQRAQSGNSAAKSNTATAKPKGTSTRPSQPLPAQAGGIRPEPHSARASEQPEIAQASASHGITAGGWLAGFVLGLGVMALLGGLGLFVATARTLRGLRRRYELEEFEN